jgi:uncharacterized protein
MSATPIVLGKGDFNVELQPRFANRHGLIAGATGSGKTVTLQVLAEGFSRMGVPVFLADVKGDLTGISQTGSNDPKLLQRARELGLSDYTSQAYPVVCWDVFGQQGHPVHATVSDMGPVLLARLLQLTDTQEGVLNIAFKVADDQGWLLLDFKDLQAILGFLGGHAADLKTDYGNISGATIGTIQRSLLVLQQQGAENFFGEPALQLADLMRTTSNGLGVINILAADKLLQTPKLYTTLLLWLLSELFEELPEIGDPEKPRLVFFFDEAHLLFTDAPKALLEKVEQVVRLIRSKGVGVYFVTQNPLDIPETILGQLGNRVQHVLRAFTPRDQKAVRSAAETFRPNPKLNTAATITTLGVGEALVSLLDDKGVPMPVEKVRIRPPSSRIGPITAQERQALMSSSTVGAHYSQNIDRVSAYEVLRGRADVKTTQRTRGTPKDAQWKPLPDLLGSSSPPATRGGRQPQSVMDTVIKTMTRSVSSSIGSAIGRKIARGILGSILKG